MVGNMVRVGVRVYLISIPTHSFCSRKYYIQHRLPIVLGTGGKHLQTRLGLGLGLGLGLKLGLIFI
jgi:hypothetical protein